MDALTSFINHPQMKVEVMDFNPSSTQTQQTFNLSLYAVGKVKSVLSK